MSGEMILYNTEDGVTVVQLRARDGSVWLSQAQIAELFEATKQNVSLHIRNVLEDGELALLWQKCDFWDSLREECVIHGAPALMEAGDGRGLAAGSRALA